MMTRIWRGWTSLNNAESYEALLREEVFPGIVEREIDGFIDITLIRRTYETEVEFVTIMWFTDMDAVREFAGDDYEAAVVPQSARALLTRFDERSVHYETVIPPMGVIDDPDVFAEALGSGDLDLDAEGSADSVDDDDEEGRKQRRAVIMEVLQNQLTGNEAPEVKVQYDRLRKTGRSDAQTRELMASVLAAYLWHTMKQDGYGYPEYVADLKKLPKIDWMSDQEGD